MRIGCQGGSTDALEHLAVVPSAVERWLVEAVVPAGLPALALAEEYGVVVLGPERVAFRHELMRRSIVDSMPVAPVPRTNLKSTYFMSRGKFHEFT